MQVIRVDQSALHGGTVVNFTTTDPDNLVGLSLVLDSETLDVVCIQTHASGCDSDCIEFLELERDINCDGVWDVLEG